MERAKRKLILFGAFRRDAIMDGEEVSGVRLSSIDSRTNQSRKERKGDAADKESETKSASLSNGGGKDE